MNRSVFRCLRTLTTWHCPHSLATRRYCNSRSTFPARRAHNSKPATAGLLLWAGGGTQRRTDMVPFLDLCSGWLGSRVVSVLDSGAEGPGFKFQPRRSHARTVVRECCKGDDESQWERVKFDPPPPKNPLTDGHQNLRT